jgi:hypothetical protein
LCKLGKSLNSDIILRRVSQFNQNLLELKLSDCGASLRCLLVRWLIELKTLKDNKNPFFNMVILTWVLSYNFVRLPNAFPFKLHYFINQCFYNSDAEVVVLGSVVVIYNYKVLVD